MSAGDSGATRRARRAASGPVSDAAQELALYRSLYEDNPLMCFAVDEQDNVVSVNRGAVEQLGYSAEELVGHSVLAVFHPDDRDAVVATLAVCRDQPGTTLSWDLRKVRRDGRIVAVREHGRAADDGEHRIVYITCEDISDRLLAERYARQIDESAQRRQQALEINDDVVQRLVTARYALDAGDIATARRTVEATIEAAQDLMEGLLEESGLPAPGDLVRGGPSESTGAFPESVGPRPPGRHGGVRVLIADDADDVRMMLRVGLALCSDVEVVGEAADGFEAVRQCGWLQPDVVLLDLAMPRMDGLQAIPAIRRRAPQTKIIVLSGYERRRAAAVASELGADGYLDKTTPIAEIAETLLGLCR